MSCGELLVRMLLLGPGPRCPSLEESQRPKLESTKHIHFVYFSYIFISSTEDWTGRKKKEQAGGRLLWFETCTEAFFDTVGVLLDDCCRSELQSGVASFRRLGA